MKGLDSNPYYLLQLRPGATPAEVERAGQRLLAMLGVGLDAARTYDTPFGPRSRDADAVRTALDTLRDPERRWLAAVWAELPASEVPPAAVPDEPWPEPMAALGWTAGQRPRVARSDRTDG